MISCQASNDGDRQAGTDPIISVIVPVYNDWDTIPALFSCLSRQTLPQQVWELIVVDNGSDSKPAPDLLPPNAQLLDCNVPGSYAARNKAVSKARGRLLLFTDADCQPVPGWLEAHAAAFGENGENTINAGGIVMSMTDTSAQPNVFEHYDLLLGIPQEHYVKNRGFGVTANLAVPKAVFAKVGLFEAKRFSGGDNEFCRRASRMGAGLAYCAQAVVYHPPRCSWLQLVTKARRIKAAQLQHGPPLRRLAYLVKTFLLPMKPLRTIARRVHDRQLKYSLMVLALRLRLAEQLEVFRLLAGGRAERK